MMMINLIFCAAIVAAAVASPFTVEKAVVCQDNQNVLEYFKPAKLSEIKWIHVTTPDELTEALKNDHFMMVLDVDYISGKLVYSEINDLNELLQEVIRASKTIGIKYNIQSKLALENLPTTVPEMQRVDDLPSLPPFPQWFHLNVLNVDGGSDPSVITDFKGYTDNKDEYNCFTFSFGWGSNDQCSKLKVKDGDVDAMIKIIKEFNPTPSKNLIIENANLLADEDIKKLKTEGGVKTFSLVINQATKINCHDPKKVGVLKANTLLTDVLVLDLSKSTETHIELCNKNKGIIEKLGTGKDLAELKWVQVNKLSNLDAVIAGDIAKVDVTNKDLTKMFLGGTFDAFYNKFAEKNALKGLHLNFKDQDVYDAFWTIELLDLTKIKEIAFSVGTDVKIGALTGTDIKYKQNKWLNCYSTSFGLAGDVKDADITSLITELDSIESAEKTISLDLDKAVALKEESVKNIFTKGHKLMMHSEKTEANKKAVRKILATGNTFINIKPELLEKILQAIKIEELVPVVATNPKILEFQKVITTQAEWEGALAAGTEPMIQMEVKEKGNDLIVEVTATPEADAKLELTLTECLSKINEKADHGIKLIVKTKEALKLILEKKPFKYLNFPVWIYLDVVGDAAIELTSLTAAEKEELKNIDHQIVLGWNKHNEPLNTENMEAQRVVLSNDIKIIYAIRADKYVDDIEKVKILLGEHKDDGFLIWLSQDINVVSKDLRTNLGTQKYFLDMPNRVIVDVCPPNQDVAVYFAIQEDFSQLLITDLVTGEDDLKTKIDQGHLIRAEIKMTKANDLYVGVEGFGLDKFFATFNTAIGITKKKGIIFSFEKPEVGDHVFKYAEMKSLNIPIWFDVEIPAVASAKALPGFNHEKDNDPIDCRTMLVSMKIPDGFKKYEKAQLDAIKAIDVGSDQVYAFRADFLEASWDILKPVFVAGTRSLNFVPESVAATFVTKDFRVTLEDTKKFMFFEFHGSHTYAMQNCPINRNFLNYFKDVDGLKTDLRKLVLTDAGKNAKAVTDTIAKGTSHILKAEVKWDDVKKQLVIDGTFTLLELLQTVDATSDKKIGLKLTFTNMEHFKASVGNFDILEKLRNMDRPLWISADVIGEKSVNLDYIHNNDVLDCSTMSLGWAGEGQEKYKKENLEAMKTAYGSSKKMYLIELLHISHVWTDVKSVLLTEKDNGNLVTLVSKEGDADKVNYADMKTILSENMGLFVYDIPDNVREKLKGGCGSISSSLTLAVLFAILPMIFY